ncbi:ATP-binding cassette domain-containing protein [Rufibacter immobilis]|uniref:ATP-binding cassette domain-containing protein n=1 Tax=Rufibacter immobilis TaxID=1348778 RepID=A0A3M9MSY4_9BACT|nr:ATP-binding cassette domain-containing protein [Rufibacter immobilis]RNI28317.1 ATP-binding cassette domain-containing protein [Rufibacter immobilis]
MSLPFLTFQNVSVRYVNQTVFSQLDFQILPGQQWALVGESGAGKTSLLQALAGRLSVVGGHVAYGFYERFLETHPKQQDAFSSFRDLVAEVGQKHTFKNHSTNTADFYYQQRYHASDAQDAPTVQEYLSGLPAPSRPNPVWTLEKVVQAVRLEELRNKPLITLSNGETKHLLLAAAMLRNPQLLLLDMPLTGLDAESRVHFNQLLSEIIASGVTVVMATSAQEIPRAITHVAVLHQGKIISAQPKENFHHQVFSHGQKPALDAAALTGLLSDKPLAAYETILELKNVNVRYGHKTVLQNVDWRVQQGERWALLGPNGAGKSTLLSLLNGDHPQAFAQDITLFDRKRGTGETIWDIRKKIGFVSPELFQFFPYQNTCLEVVESGLYDTLGLMRKSQPENAAQALRWLELMGVADAKDKPLRTVSASVQRLCLLARALIKHPPLLILDEPCQGMDAQQQRGFKELLEQICAHSTTTLLYVTHYAQEIPACVTKVLRLEQGKVLAPA